MAKFGITLSLVAATLIGYAVYFDYQRHHSSEFRQNLKKSEKQFQKKAEKNKKKESRAKLEQVKSKLLTSLDKDPVPKDISEKESYFMKQLGVGEQLAASPGKEIDAALCFYKALAVHPNPTDILNIYQRTVPEHVYELVVMMIAIKPPLAVVNILGEASIEELNKSDNLD